LRDCQDFFNETVNVDNENKIAVLQAMLSQIKFDDPRFRLFIEEEIKRNNKRQKPKGSTREVVRRLKIQNKKLLEQVAFLKEQLKQIKSIKAQTLAQLGQVTKLNNSLSDALGSCQTCWGEDPDCKVCFGNGSPGWRNSNRRRFNIYVLPTLEKLYGLSEKLK
jgi:hypothetical protein